MDKDQLQILAQVYSTYSDAKEKFIDRNFATNRYYLALSIALLLISLAIHALTSSIFLMTTVSAIGIVVAILWWLNLDSYQFLIKIKYANILEIIEENFPAQPYRDEFKTVQEIKKNKKAIVFADLQKGFAFLILLIFLIIFCINIARTLSFNSNAGIAPYNSAPVQEIIDDNAETINETK